MVSDTKIHTNLRSK